MKHQATVSEFQGFIQNRQTLPSTVALDMIKKRGPLSGPNDFSTRFFTTAANK